MRTGRASKLGSRRSERPRRFLLFMRVCFVCL
jgi:hypothetical protein